MADYGMVVWDADGYVQFNSEDPGVFVKLPQTATPSTLTEGGKTVYRTGDIVAIANDDLTIARPKATQSGSIGMLRWGGNVYLYSGETINVDGGLQQLGAYAEDITWYDVDDASNLTCSGYGLCIWDDNDPQKLTFSSTDDDLGSWCNIVNITAKGTATGSNGMVEIYDAGDETTFNKCYGIMNGHQYRWAQITDGGDPLKEELEIHHRSYYFDAVNYKIYACDFNISESGYRTIGIPIDIGDFTDNGTLENDFYVIQLT